ncbi:leucine-rich repeat and fibronectin type-III domain-containing protein 2-like, partial [Salmo trutta]|uniref:leucine-rich repeat and fibronectin type-III domain-containing protein 2-like n=1 Tax=Salmo trutta TaxID=8032 RepID=UPI001131E141
ILPSTSNSFMLKNLVSGADYNLCVLAIFDDIVTSLAATKVLGCAQFSTKDLYPECRSLQTHFLGGTLTILVGGVVVVTLLVFTVALMVRHRVCSNQDDHCHHGDDSDELACCQGGSLGSPVKEAAAGGGGGVYSQSNGNGDMMMVVLPNGLPSKQRGGRTKERAKEKKKDKEKGNEGRPMGKTTIIISPCHSMAVDSSAASGRRLFHRTLPMTRPGNTQLITIIPMVTVVVLVTCRHGDAPSAPR